MSAPPLIEIENLVFRYAGAGSGRDEAFRLACDELHVGRGERVALHGPSGCGKSTLLNLVAGALRAERGTLRVGGAELSTLSERERRAHRIRTMGFVFQDFPLIEHLDGRENVLLPYRLNRALVLDQRAKRRADELLQGLGLSSRARARAAELSQGERQRVAIARALVTEPDLLLADEPTAGLDPERAASVCAQLEQLAETRGMTLLLVTHDPAILARFSRSVDVSALGSAPERP